MKQLMTVWLVVFALVFCVVNQPAKAETAGETFGVLSIENLDDTAWSYCYETEAATIWFYAADTNGNGNLAAHNGVKVRMPAGTFKVKYNLQEATYNLTIGNGQKSDLILSRVHADNGDTLRLSIFENGERKPGGNLLTLLAPNKKMAISTEWMSNDERDYWKISGYVAEINGKSLKADRDISVINSIKDRAAEPLKSRIANVVKAGEMIKITPEEQRQMAEYKNKIAKCIQASFLFGPVEMYNYVMKNAPVVDSWRLQRIQIERIIEAFKLIIENNQAIVNDLKSRTQRLQHDAQFRMKMVDGDLCIEGIAPPGGTNDTLVRVYLYQQYKEGQETVASIMAGMGLKAIGADALDKDVMAEGTRFAMAKDRGSKIIFDERHFYLPNVPGGSKFTIDLQLNSPQTNRVSRVSASLYTPEGWTSDIDAKGLDSVKK